MITSHAGTLRKVGNFQFLFSVISSSSEATHSEMSSSAGFEPGRCSFVLKLFQLKIVSCSFANDPWQQGIMMICVKPLRVRFLCVVDLFMATRRNICLWYEIVIHHLHRNYVMRVHSIHTVCVCVCVCVSQAVATFPLFLFFLFSLVTQPVANSR